MMTDIVAAEETAVVEMTGSWGEVGDIEVTRLSAVWKAVLTVGGCSTSEEEGKSGGEEAVGIAW